MWVAQGDIVDRSQEILGRTDIPIVLLRRQLEEQIKLVEQGQAPMNYFEGETTPTLYGSCEEPVDWMAEDWFRRKHVFSQAYRKMYHKGFALDDADRYGPAIELVKDLHRRIEEFEIAARAPASP